MATTTAPRVPSENKPSAVVAAKPHVAWKSMGVTARGVIDQATLKALPMHGAAVTIAASGYFLRVTVRSEFVNRTPNVLKAFAVLDVPTRHGGYLAMVRADVGNKFLTSKLVPHTGAPTTTATPRPTDAAAIDFPWEVHAGASVTVTAVYFLPMAAGLRDVRLTIPRELIPDPGTTITETGSGGDADGGAAGDSWKSKFVVKTEQTLQPMVLIHGRGSLLFPVEGSGAKSSIPGAAVTRMGDARRFEVRYENRDRVGPLLKDFDVTATLAVADGDDAVKTVVVEEDAPFVREDHKYAITVSLAPKFGSESVATPNTELCIACDCSGSMAPWSSAVADAVRTSLASLPESVFANLMRFGATQQWARPESALLSEDVYDTLKAFPIGDADLGSTRLYQAVASAYMRPFVKGYARAIVLLSDGGDDQHCARILELAAANKHTTRVVAISLGKYASVPLFEQMAAVSNGVHLHVESPDELAAAVAKGLNRVLVPTLCSTSVEFAYDGQEAAPPVRLTNDHPPLVPMGTRSILYAFGGASLKGCTVKASGLLGGEYREFKAFTGALDDIETNSASENDVTSVSLAHAAVAASRIDALVNFNAKSALSDAERAEVVALSTAFSVPSPYTQQQCRSGEATAAAFDPGATVVRCPFSERRADYYLPPAPVPRGPNGSAVDPDVFPPAVPAATAPPAASPSCPPGASATVYFRSVVTGLVDSVAATTRIEEVIRRQTRAGFWKAASAFPALDHFGMEFKDVSGGMPNELVPPPSRPRTRPSSTSGSHRSASSPTQVNDRPPSTGAAAAVAEAPPSPTTGGEEAVDASIPERVTTPDLPPRRPATPPPPYNGAYPEDLWTTAVLVACIEGSMLWDKHERTRWTQTRAQRFLDSVGAAGVRAQAAAQAFVSSRGVTKQ